MESNRGRSFTLHIGLGGKEEGVKVKERVREREGGGKELEYIGYDGKKLINPAPGF